MLLRLRESEEGVVHNSTLIGVRGLGRLDRLFAKPFIGKFFRRIITRLPFYPLREHVLNLEDTVRVLEQRLERQLGAMSDRVDSARNRLDDQRRVAEAALNRMMTRATEQLSREPWAESVLLLADRQEEITAKLDQLSRTPVDAQSLNEAIGLLVTAFRPVAEAAGWTETGAALVARAAEALRLQERRIHTAENLAEQATQEVRQQALRLNLLLETVRRRSEPFDGGQAATIIEQQDRLLDPLYLEFEARFRGSRKEVQDRALAHLPVILDAKAGSPDRPIIDLGAGRGEWLELLKQHGLQALGIDLNAAMVNICNEFGLACRQGDAVAELAKLPSDSHGAVTGFHLVEHLPFRALVALLDEALRVLKPGGVMVLETPDPANLQVGSRWFYLDPAHRNPLPSEMLTMVAEFRGFVGLTIRKLNPMTETFDASDKILGKQLDALLHGPMDYALIAYKA
jgi:O-antigen chain-terminating methyltransferase